MARGGSCGRRWHRYPRGTGTGMRAAPDSMAIVFFYLSGTLTEARPTTPPLLVDFRFRLAILVSPRLPLLLVFAITVVAVS